MSQGQERKSAVGLRDRRVGVADYRGRDCCAEVGWGGEHGSWVSEVEAHGTGQEHRMQGAGERAPGGQWKTWLASCGGG